MTDEPCVSSASVDDDPDLRLELEQAHLHQRTFSTFTEVQIGDNATTLNEPNEDVLDKKGRKSMAKQFQSCVALSTFICTLVVAYIAFVNAMAGNNRRNIALGIPYNSGIFLALLAIQLHAASIIISCQRTASCNNLSNHCVSKDFENSLAICGSLQFGGTTFFVLAVLESSCLFFDHYLYVGTFLAISLSGLVAFTYGNGELSKAYTNILVVRKLMKVDVNRLQDPEAK